MKIGCHFPLERMSYWCGIECGAADNGIRYGKDPPGNSSGSTGHASLSRFIHIIIHIQIFGTNKIHLCFKEHQIIATFLTDLKEVVEFQWNFDAVTMETSPRHHRKMYKDST